VESALSDSVVVITSSVSVTDDLAPSIPTLSIGPNPFTSLTVIRYYILKSTKVQLIVYNLRGQKVRTLEADTKTAGEHVLAWEGCDDNAQPVSSGVYFLRLLADGKECYRQKLVLVK
jgi:flagellar hook assembly protein FlgD